MSSPAGESNAFAVFDVGKFVSDHLQESNKSSQHKYCSPGILFLSSPVATASREDNIRLRNELAIVTLVDTQVSENKIYRYSENTPTKYLQDSFFEQKLLGLTLHHVQFRMGEYIQDIMNELPANVSKAILARAAKSGNPNDPQTKQQFQLRVLSRTSVEDSFAVLTKSMAHIRLVFSTIFSNPQSYPLLLSGDYLFRDNSILVFLLLMLLEIPIQVIDRIHCTVLEQASRNADFVSTVESSKLAAIWLADKSHWAKSLKDRLDTKYGGVSEYLVAVGVSKSTQERIVQLLRNPVNRMEGFSDLLPPPSYESSMF